MTQIKIPTSEQLDTLIKPRFNVLSPKSYSDIEYTANGFGQSIKPMSIGYDDGIVYGSASTYKRIFHCSNSFETMTATDLIYGQRFDQVEGFVGNIVGVWKTTKGFIVIESDISSFGAVWFSPTFDGGYTKVVTLDRGFVNPMNMSVYNNGNESVCMVSEYKNGIISEGLRLFASFDGGETWSIIKTLPNSHINNAQNQHWHTHCYDPYDGRIWASQGDGDNSNLFYSYDRGATWDIVPLSSYSDLLPSHHPQPTLMMPFERKLCCGPDNGLRSGILSLIKDYEYTGTIENFSWLLDYAVNPKIGAASGSYPIPFYAINKNEAYVICNSGFDLRYIVATGDAGKTWHKVGTIYTNSAPIGIVGIDKNGYMFIYSDIGSVIYKVKKTEWF